MDRFDAVVVGAGFAGMYALHRFARLGLSVRCFEAAGDVGGTWWWNRYPGARCDIESLDYSYSFSPELEQEWDWTERYATQPEILRYADHVADRFDLRRDIRVRHPRRRRTVGRRAERLAGRRPTAARPSSARFLVMADGCPVGAEAAGGRRARHVRRADATTRPAGRTTASTSPASASRVIGTGSSGIQAIPLIAEQADHLTVFQRTPNYSIPARNAPLDPTVVAARKAGYPAHREQAAPQPDRRARHHRAELRHGDAGRRARAALPRRLRAGHASTASRSRSATC